MNPRNFANLTGVLFLSVGILTLVPSLCPVSADLLPLRFSSGSGWGLGVLPMNLINKLLLICFGVFGLASAHGKEPGPLPSRLYARIVFCLMGTLSLLGMFAKTQTLFGLCPLYGNQVIAYGFAALFAALYAFRLPNGRKLSFQALRTQR